MPEFEVVLTDRAIADLEALPLKLRLQVSQEIASLVPDPFPSHPGVRKLKGYRPPLYRLRAGDYRVLYRVSQQRVTVLRVIDRRDLERSLEGF